MRKHCDWCGRSDAAENLLSVKGFHAHRGGCFESIKKGRLGYRTGPGRLRLRYLSR